MTQQTRLHNRSAVGLFIVSTVILVARSFFGLDRLPADPANQYIVEGGEYGFRSLLLGDPYFHIAARVIGYIVSWVPIFAQAITLSSLVHLVWAASAVLIAQAISEEVRSTRLGVAAALLLVLAPHAAESSLGNVGNVKWPLIAAVIVVCSCSSFAERRLGTAMFLVALSGLSQPLTVLCIIPILVQIRAVNGVRKHHLCLTAMIVGTLATQVAKVGPSATLSGQSTRTTRPWSGMGLFWWSGLLGPTLVGVTVVAITLLTRSHRTSVGRLALSLSLTALAIQAASYRLGGIADRYFVVPMTFVLIAALLSVAHMFQSSHRSRTFVVVIFFALLSIPTVKWFGASWYLTTGPRWSEGVRQATLECDTSLTERVEIPISPHGRVEIACEELRDD